jgi:hypothetical protein
MRLLPLAVAMALVSTASSAQPGPSTEAMTCHQAQSFVAGRGAVVLNTGPFTYSRFVSSIAYCSMVTGEVTEPEWVRTRDDPQCALFVCRQRLRSRF